MVRVWREHEETQRACVGRSPRTIEEAGHYMAVVRTIITREYPARCSGKFDMIYMRRNKKNVRA
jgi:hypothetical protein